MRLSILLIVLSSIVAQAGGSRAGNGGDGVYCSSSPSQPQLQLLDFYELTFYDNLTVDLGDVNEDPVVKVTKIIESFKRISPIRADRYKERLLNFFNRIQWSQAPLQDIPDSNHVVLPVGCEIRQLVIQNKVNDLPQYLVDQSLWQILNGTQRAGLILHEIIYEEALEQGQINSINTRALVRYFAKKKFAVVNDFNDLNRVLFDLEFYRLLEVAFDSGDVGLLSQYSDYPTVRIDNLSSLKFCGYFLNAAKVYVNNCNNQYNYEFNVTGFEGSEKYANRQINRVYSLKADSLIYIVDPGALNLNFPILDFDTSGFIPAQDMIFENKNFKIVCEKGYWATLAKGLEFNYYELDKNPVVSCGNPENSNSHHFFKFDGMLYEYNNRPVPWGVLQFDLIKSASVLIGKNKLEIKQFHLSDNDETIIYPGKKGLKIDLGKNGYCMVESYNSKITFLNDEEKSIDIDLGGNAPKYDYCHVKFNGVEYLNANRIKVTKRGMGAILDVN